MTASTSPTSKPVYPTTDSVDVLLLLEGTFPFVAGGVSSWVNQIIRGFPEIRFGAIFLGSRPQDYGDLRYPLPENLVHLQTAYLFEEQGNPPIMPVKASEEAMSMVKDVHAIFEENRHTPQCGHLFSQLMNEAGPDGLLSHEVFLYSKSSWEFIKESYRRRSTDPSFVDYFWTIRTIHTPFWRLRDVAISCPKARIYHSVSTGYAGILGVLLKHRNHRPFMLSEHGIYVKERKIDLYQAQWLKDNRSVFERDPSRVSYFRQLWIRFFEHLGYVTYQAADDILALYEANRQRQLQDGAPAERTANIPNGIDVARFAPLRTQRGPEIPQVLCLIGRVVPIKDIKTFIRAMRTVANHLPNAEAWIAGPEDESPEYARECRDIAEQLGLGHYLLLMGMIWLVYRNYHSDRFVAFDIWKPGAMYLSLMATGFFFNLGAWIDKLMFWYFPDTGQQVIGPLHASVIYDFPIFLSYLSVIPGMAVFLVRIETDFVEYYIKFYDAVREGATLDYIERMRNHMVYHVQRGLFDIAKIQAIAVLVTFALGGVLLEWIGISPLYLPLLYVDVVGAALQVVLLGILNVLFYLDQRRAVLALTMMLPATNVVLTAISLFLGPAWFGYGFALSMLITVLTGVWILNRKLEHLEYQTFMLQ